MRLASVLSRGLIALAFGGVLVSAAWAQDSATAPAQPQQNTQTEPANRLDRGADHRDLRDAREMRFDRRMLARDMRRLRRSNLVYGPDSPRSRMLRREVRRDLRDLHRDRMDRYRDVRDGSRDPRGPNQDRSEAPRDDR
jgi:hypothetical protein